MGDENQRFDQEFDFDELEQAILTPTQGKGGTALTESPAHLAWIAQYAATHFLTASCGSGCKAMLKRFPALLLVRGYVCLSNGQRAAHWWLEDVDGNIADPTAEQFTDPKGCYRAESIIHYDAFDETQADKLPTGKCPNCGRYCYHGDDFCDEQCFTRYVAYCNEY